MKSKRCCDATNYFEHIAYLEAEGHIKTKDKKAMFEYWFELLNQPKFAALRRYASKFGFEGVANSLGGSDDDYMFIYGTLMQGYEAHNELSLPDHLTYVGDATITGRLYDLGDYPGLIIRNQTTDDLPGEPRPVTGELYRVKDESIYSRIDDFERYDSNDREGSLYVRQMIQLDDPQVDAWVYTYNSDIENPTVIDSGDWRSYDN